MNVLPETTYALGEMPANFNGLIGNQESEQVKVAAGVFYDEVDFDPEIHTVDQIDYFSPWAEVLGTPQVVERQPLLPIRANIVLHQPESLGLDKEFEYAEGRRRIGETIARSLGIAVEDSTNLPFIYTVGELAAEIEGIRNVEVLKTEGDPSLDAEIIAGICNKGLTFLIGDFLKLPLRERQGSFPSTIGIKANIPYDLKLPGSKLSLRSGIKGGEVNTSKAQEIEKVNEALGSLHQQTIDEAESLGIHMAPVVLMPSDSLLRVRQQADRPIASAIRKVNKALAA